MTINYSSNQVRRLSNQVSSNALYLLFKVCTSYREYSRFVHKKDEIYQNKLKHSKILRI